MPASIPTNRQASQRPARHIARTLLVGLLLGAASAVFVGPELFGLASSRPFAQVVAFRPVAAAGLLALAALTVLIRRRWWPVALVLGVVAGVALGAVLPRAVAGPLPPAGPELTVLSFNVSQGRADVEALAAEIRRSTPDLVVLPEAGQRFAGRLAPLLGDLGYRSSVTTAADEPDGSGIVVLTSARLGTVSTTPLDLGNKFRWMRLTGGGLGQVQVVAMHTAAPVPGMDAAWGNDLGMLGQWCAGGHAARILVGDVNATLDHAQLRAAVAGCTDAAADRGQGLVATWPTKWPRWFGVQIDHVFTGGGLRPASVQVLDLPGSDHRALLTSIALPPR
jgi:endonuclease/exonuclease/phosphatase (EEP) superfamily protein YafD